LADNALAFATRIADANALGTSFLLTGKKNNGFAEWLFPQETHVSHIWRPQFMARHFAVARLRTSKSGIRSPPLFGLGYNPCARMVCRAYLEALGRQITRGCHWRSSSHPVTHLPSLQVPPGSPLPAGCSKLICAENLFSFLGEGVFLLHEFTVEFRLGKPA